jgi:hypothetical protein
MSISINKEKFDKFEKVKMSGLYNMWDKNARFETDLTEEEWLTIMTDYGKLKDAWSNNNNNNGDK